MAKLRDASAYRRLKRPNTRVSKYRKKSYVKGIPGSKIIMFEMGDKSRIFPYAVKLIASKDINLRHNAIEAARITSNRYLATILGKKGYGLRFHTFPHHVNRENPLATGAGADRLQQGMRAAFGKPIGRSAQVKKGKIIMTAFVEENSTNHARIALKKAASKFPIKCSVEIEKLAE